MGERPHLTVDDLEHYSRDELDRKARARVESHVASCTQCQLAWRQFQAGERLLAECRQATEDGRVHVPGGAPDQATEAYSAGGEPAPSGLPVSGQTWGKFVIERRLGGGGQAEVFQAFDRLGPGGQVALKVPRHPMSMAHVEKWIGTEAAPLSRLDHPHIVRVVDAGRVGHWPYIATELIDGLPLHEAVGRIGPSPRTVLGWMIQLADAVQYAHSRGITHRDLKPQNVVITPQGEPLLVDFGLAGLVTPYEPSARPDEGLTPAFAAPEQARAERATDHRVDVFGLGAILRFLLTSEGPYHGTDNPLLAAQRGDVRPVVPDVAPGLTRSLARIADRATAPAPKDRYQTAGHMARELRRLRWSPVAIAVGMTTCVLVAALALVLWPRNDSPPPVPNGESGGGQTGPVSNGPDRGERTKATRPETPMPDQMTLTLDAAVQMRLMLIRPGTFTMGSGPTEKGHQPEEAPQHQVTITQPFYMGRTEVTVGQFRAFVRDTSHRTDAERTRASNTWDTATKGLTPVANVFWDKPGFAQGDEHPVVCVSWHDAQAFCRWLSKKTGKRVRLPTEAEWEYACRAGSTGRFWFGDSADRLKDCDWIDGNSGGAPHVVATKTPNPWGLHDMHGNVGEWCGDWYARRYYQQSCPTDPAGPADTDASVTSGVRCRVNRGGSWAEPEGGCRCACRGNALVRFSGTFLGFRVVVEVETAG